MALKCLVCLEDVDLRLNSRGSASWEMMQLKIISNKQAQAIKKTQSVENLLD